MESLVGSPPFTADNPSIPIHPSTDPPPPFVFLTQHLLQQTGKAAAVPWATGAALREVYASSSSGSNKKGSSSDKTEGGEGGGKPSKESGGGSGSSAEEEGVESVHARCLTPVMLAGGDALVAALGGLEAAGGKGGWVD